jgi:hypothetical protein
VRRAPGGRVVLEDDDHDVLRFTPVPEFEEAWRAYMRAYEAVGNDPSAANFPALIASGCGPRGRLAVLRCVPGSANFDVIVSNCRAIMVSAHDAVVRHGDVRGRGSKPRAARVRSLVVTPARRFVLHVLGGGIKPGG